MKTIKELTNKELDNYDNGYWKALKEVLELIDEFMGLEYELDKALEELKARINGE